MIRKRLKMLRIIFVVLLSIPVMAQSPIPVNAQVGVRILPRITGVKGPSGAQMSYKTPGKYRRVIRDATRQALFAYEIEITPVGGGTYRITALPASAEFLQSLESGRVPSFGPRNSPIPTLPSVTSLDCVVGGTVSLDLLSKSSTGQTISDAITLVDLTAPANGAAPDGVLHLERHDFRLNGASMYRGDLGVSGENVMIFLPAHGGFFLSLSKPPNLPQFQKSGYVEGNILKFTWKNQAYQIVSGEPILSNGGSAEVWLFVEPLYVPKQQDSAGSSAIVSGDASSMKAWFGKD